MQRIGSVVEPVCPALLGGVEVAVEVKVVG
jgi:hypothetical protein